jgi:hypothetical protein
MLWYDRSAWFLLELAVMRANHLIVYSCSLSSFSVEDVQRRSSLAAREPQPDRQRYAVFTLRSRHPRRLYALPSRPSGSLSVSPTVAYRFGFILRCHRCNDCKMVRSLTQSVISLVSALVAARLLSCVLVKQIFVFALQLPRLRKPDVYCEFSAAFSTFRLYSCGGSTALPVQH